VDGTVLEKKNTKYLRGLSMSEVVITIPTKRKPPVKTLENYSIPPGYICIIIADPDVFEEHLIHYGTDSNISVVTGAKGMAAQCAQCYIHAHLAGYPWYFRLDDDLDKKTFIHKDGHFPELAEVISYALECVKLCKVSLAGFANTSNRSWLGDDYGRTYGLIHGGGHICKSAADPTKYIDVSLVRGSDVYMTCAHREEDGAVGRVKFIGFNKRGSTITAGTSSIKVSQEEVDASRDKIIARFPDMVTCTGTRPVTPSSDIMIANWRMKRDPKYNDIYW
jgi:hypothetical protein